MKTKTIVLFAVLLTLAPAAFAQVEIIGRYAWIDTDTHEEIESDPDQSRLRLEVEDTTGWGLALNFYLGDRFSIEVGGSIVEPDVIITETDDQSGALVNTAGIKMIPLTAVVQYHFRPEGPLDFYVGGGVGYVLLDDIEGEDLGDLDVDRIELDEDGGLVLNVGLNWMLTGSIGANFDAKYIPLDSAATVVFPGAEGTTADISVNPIIVSGGLSIRF